MKDFPVDYSQDAEHLLPQIYGHYGDISEPEHFGLEVMRRLELRPDEVIRKTKDSLPDKSFELKVEDVGVDYAEAQDDAAFGSGKHWKIDWSCISFKGRTIRARDPIMERVTIELTDKKDELTAAYDVQPGDLFVRPHWLNMILIYRASKDPKDSASPLLNGSIDRDVRTYTVILSEYSFVSICAVHPDHRRHLQSTKEEPRGNAEALVLQHSDREGLFQELRNSSLNASGARVCLKIGWPCLLRFWELMDTELLRWEGLDGQTRRFRDEIGTWEEELSRAICGHDSK